MSRMTKVLMVMVLAVLCAPSWLLAAGPLPVVNGIRVFKAGETIGVEVSADKPVEFSCTKMQQLLRVIIDLPGTELGNLKNSYRYKSALVSDVRFEKKAISDVAYTRVTVNLTEDADFTVRPDPEKKKVTILLRKAGTVPATALRSSAGSKAPTAGATTPVPAVTASKSNFTSASAESQPVAVTAVDWGRDGFEIKASRSIDQFKAFTLQEPGRLVIDIPGAVTTLNSIAIPANRFDIEKGRIAPFQGKLRLVFESGDKPFPKYEVVKTGTGLRVVLKTTEPKK